MSYSSIPYHERIFIEYMLTIVVASLRTIARALGRSVSSIHYEIHTNKYVSKSYNAHDAQRLVDARKKQKRVCPITENPGIIALVTRWLKHGLSPDAMHGRAKREGGTLYTYLACHRKRRKKRHFSRNIRSFEQQKTRVSDRPAEIHSRTTKGDWEIDTLHAKKRPFCVLTAEERPSRYIYAVKLSRATIEKTQEALRNLIRLYPDTVDRLPPIMELSFPI